MDSKSIDRFLEEYGKMVETSKRGERGVIRTFFFLLLSPFFFQSSRGEGEGEKEMERGGMDAWEMSSKGNDASAGVGGRRAKWVFSVRVCFGLVES